MEAIVNHTLLPRQVQLTQLVGRAVKIALPMVKRTTARQPTKMGERLLTFMAANNVTNQAQFAEGVLGISRQRFQNWLYVQMRDVEATPLLRAADSLGTNPEYLLGLSDDPRPARQIGLRESQLLDAFRVMSERDRDRLLKQATDWVSESVEPGSALAPFRHVATPIEREK